MEPTYSLSSGFGSGLNGGEIVSLVRSSRRPSTPSPANPQHSRPLLQTPVRGLAIPRRLSSFSKFLLAIDQQSSFTKVSGLRFSLTQSGAQGKKSVEGAKWRRPRHTGWGTLFLLYSHTARICERVGRVCCGDPKNHGSFTHWIFYLLLRMSFI